MATVLARPAPSRAPAPTPGPAAARTRDAFVDAVRAIGTVGVVALHWTMAEASFDGRTLHVGNALGHGAAWALSWLFQVLPLLFFAAGASAGYQHAGAAPRRDTGRDAGWGGVLVGRVRGVGRPVAAFAVTWVVVVGALLAAGAPADAVGRLAVMAPQLLWFLAVWLVLATLTPALRQAWRRWRWRALAVAVAAPLVVDALRFGAGARPLAWANVLLVWAVPFLAGVAYADVRAAGRTGVPRPVTLWTGLACGVAAMALLVAVGPYPPSMVGMPGDAISNLSPPTAPVVAQAVAQVCAVLLARAAITRWARGSGRVLVVLLARRSMTVYLWHLTAMFTVVGVDLLVLGEQLPVPWSVDWWASRPAWVAAYGLVLAALVRAFGRFEGRRSEPGAPERA